VAAYRTAVEAVTNVARHAGVERATLDFEVLSGTTLRITVRDAGRSVRPWRPGVGLESMRERVEQIGGVLTIDGGVDGGTVVADLPLTLSSSTGPPASA
jgi:signal transduction histidine kinase